MTEFEVAPKFDNGKIMSAENRSPRVQNIDDDPHVSKIVKLRLESFGIDVIRSFNGMHGFWTAVDMVPDVILVDLNMPNGDGPYIIQRLRAHPLTHEIPLIVLSGQSNPDVKRQLLSMGIDGYLTKPIDFSVLTDKLRNHIQFPEQPVKDRVYLNGHLRKERELITVDV